MPWFLPALITFKKDEKILIHSILAEPFSAIDGCNLLELFTGI
jgi:hypothetical protein